MKKNAVGAAFAVALVFLTVCGVAIATETEHLGMQVLPAPGKVSVDGKYDDWDLTSGVFVCSDVENQREKFSVWVHMMWDAQNLYVLARWSDETPLNNPGSAKGDYGFAGDCLQFRTIVPADLEKGRCTHWDNWRDRDGVDTISTQYGRQFNQGADKNLLTKGAQQVFAKRADGKGYVQEIALPWKFAGGEGYAPKAGEQMLVTVEPNFTIGTSGRLTLKDVFRVGVTVDRVFTFMASQHWGQATLEKNGKLQPPRSVRLTDGREFAVKMEKGLPVIDWTGLIKSKELKGFKTIAFDVPEDGHVSLNIKDKDGGVVRQLLSNSFVTKGKKEVKWDGLTTFSVTRPGLPVAAGEYRWEGIWHQPIGLRLRGWACNGGSAPYDGVTGKENWGGDHGLPCCAASDDTKVYLGWSGAEAGKALVACDQDGNVQWKNSRGGMAGAELVAVDGGTVYAQNWGGNLYRVDSTKGGYTEWEGRGSTDLSVRALLGDDKAPESASGMHALGGVLYVSVRAANAVAVADGKSGKLIRKLDVQAPGDVEAVAKDKIYVISEGTTVLAINPENGQATPFATGLSGASGLAADKAGSVYVGVREPDNQVLVFGADGKQTGAIGRKGGRAKLGAWTPDGMLFIAGMTVDPAGKLWVMESDDYPKRVSVWDTKTGALVKDFFGPTTYGALGGAINPMDPDLMVGKGCEWRLDKATGKAACLGTITRSGMENSRFGIGSNGKLYLAVAGNWAFTLGPISIFERVGDADYKLRTQIFYLNKDGKEIKMSGHGEDPGVTKTGVWSDENGDGQRQDNEIALFDGRKQFSGWYMAMAPDLTFYKPGEQYKLTGFTACGAPRYDLGKPNKFPSAGTAVLGSADGTSALYGGEYNVVHGVFTCVDVATGKVKWTYPDNFVGVHGSHMACPPEVGMIRGSFGPCGSAKLPPPIGNVWVIATNVGEWHILTEEGYYLTHMFQSDPMKIVWPEKALPGAVMDNTPCGMGGEDFGGSIAATKDGRLFLQAGKTGFWNVEVVGTETATALKGGKLSMSEKDVAEAVRFREMHLQETAGKKTMTVKKLTPAFTGDLAKDFAGATVVTFNKSDTEVKAALAWDDKNLYAAWDVRDDTPWANGADAPEYMYAHGDTVDVQLGTDAKAEPNRGEAVLGDLRLSIGQFAGKDTAVIYRLKAKTRNPKEFKSGVVASYRMDSVLEVKDAKISVTRKQDGKGYVVEASIPLQALELKASAGLSIRGDMGVTHGDKAAQDTVLRTYWSNQVTGIVNDEVFELQMEPRNWGEMKFVE